MEVVPIQVFLTKKQREIILEALKDYQNWFDEDEEKFKEIQRAIDSLTTNGSDLVNKKLKKQIRRLI